MKKSFTLIEVVISVTIMSILLLFMYKVLNDGKIFNDKLKLSLNSVDSVNYINNIFIEDIAESTSKINYYNDKNKNTIVYFSTNNIYNNIYFTNVAYFISENNELLRIESKESLPNLNKNTNSSIKIYVDKLLDNIESFELLQNNDKYTFVIKRKKLKRFYITTFKILD